MEMGCFLHARLEANTAQELVQKVWRKDEFLGNVPDDTSPPGSYAQLEANTAQELVRKVWEKDEFLGNVPDDTSPPGSYAVSNGGPEHLRTFRRILLLPFLGCSSPKRVNPISLVLSTGNKFRLTDNKTGIQFILQHLD